MIQINAVVNSSLYPEEEIIKHPLKEAKLDPEAAN